MNKHDFLKYMEEIYHDIKEKGISTDQLKDHIRRSLSLPREEGWVVLEDLLSQCGLKGVQRIPHCHCYELVALGEEGVKVNIEFDERYPPKVTVIMFNQEGQPLGYKEKIFRNPQEVGSWIRQTIGDFLQVWKEICASQE
ncbi:hypothetical protein [Ammoniphilus sp. 3BR4]|uniref:hypothetical protein n=1 Tax=Ammoniphilus sp. 3BR4 TaxID=3158265 RepID=UPI003465406E